MNTLVRLFPDYEDVFFDEIEKHSTYFLPLCSFNLQLLDPRLDQWLHFVSVKEIYDGCIGQNTTSYHRNFTQLDSIGFDIIDGKYKFDGDWNFFSQHRLIEANEYDQHFTTEEIEFAMNDAMYALKKAYYQKQGTLYDRDQYRPGLEVNDIRRLERLRKLTAEDLEQDTPCNYAKERIEQKIAGIFEELNTAQLPLDQCTFDGTDLLQIPTYQGKILDYLGYIEGYDFQLHAADAIALFYQKDIQKAVICFTYS
ncbi:hypothetical protein [Myroides sp. TSA_177.3]|uniref:hypothetical protein n=1 Tax=Myroides sp. TSA_177.3 TaxID=3415650 RepID=UPI00404533DA